MNLNLQGSPSSDTSRIRGVRYAIKPTDFLGLAPIPKMMKEVGDTVLAGEPLFYDKSQPDVYFVSPVSGELIELNRGAKRKIEELVLLADKEQRYFEHGTLSSLNREEIVDYLKRSGGLSLFKQRPFGLVPDPSMVPKNIFVSTFNTNPFAPHTDIIIQGQEQAIKMAIELLSELTSGEVYLSYQSKKGKVVSDTFGGTKAKLIGFEGPHPAGNVGVQIHHIKPIRPGDHVWTLGLQELISLGNLIQTGEFYNKRWITIGGAMLENPHHVHLEMGMNIADILSHFNGWDNDDRIISGNVLSGTQVNLDGYLSFYDEQISLVREGNYYEMFGWLLPQKLRPSASGTFPNHFFKGLSYDVDTNTHGERRAFVMTGQYEKVLPMNIYPQHLFKAILTNDFEKMEGLGIHELLEEDVALCEFVCTSKMPLQKILREGLEEVRLQG